MIKRLIATTGFLIAAFTLMVGGLGSAVAQNQTGATPEADDASHPAHIHSGSCDELGDVVFPLENVSAADSLATPETDEADVLDLVSTPEDAMSSPEAGMDAMHDGMNAMEGTLMSVTTVDVSLDDILAAEHAINVHESAENIQNYVACGDLTGTPDNGELVVTLDELNDSGLSGEATLTDNGDGTTTVEISLDHDDMGTPEATPAA